MTAHPLSQVVLIGARLSSNCATHNKMIRNIKSKLGNKIEQMKTEPIVLEYLRKVNLKIWQKLLLYLLLIMWGLILVDYVTLKLSVPYGYLFLISLTIINCFTAYKPGMLSAKRIEPLRSKISNDFLFALLLSYMPIMPSKSESRRHPWMPYVFRLSMFLFAASILFVLLRIITAAILQKLA